MRRRLRKQLTVVAVLASVLGGLLALVGVLTYTPSPPASPPPPSYQPLAVRSTHLFRHDSFDRADLLALVKNPNAGAGVSSVEYTFDVRGADGTAVASVPGRTFFLPGQEKPVAALNVTVPQDGAEVVLRFGALEWFPVGADFHAPSFVPVHRTASVRERPSPLYEVKAVLASESDLDYGTVEVTALGFDDQGVIIGVGRTFVGSLLAGERREFTVSWPLPRGATVAETRIFPEVNVFSKAAVQQRTGLPGQEPRPIATPSGP